MLAIVETGAGHISDHHGRQGQVDVSSLVPLETLRCPLSISKLASLVKGESGYAEG